MIQRIRALIALINPQTLPAHHQPALSDAERVALSRDSIALEIEAVEADLAAATEDHDLLRLELAGLRAAFQALFSPVAAAA